MLLDKSIQKLSDLIKRKEISSVQLVEEAYARIETLNPRLNVFTTLRKKEEVLREAQEADTRDPVTPLHGLPYAIKDAYATQDIRTTASSNVLKDFVPPYDSTVYKKLKKAGAILLGKTNMDAWGHGATTENTDFGPTKNPWDLTRVAGGSSGGSAVAVAVRFVAFAMGEDTGGSIRNPAAWTNTTGLKVTYGRVSRYGAAAYASSFDTMGPLGKTVEDCACVLEHIAGIDPYDGSSSPEPVKQYQKILDVSLQKKVIAIPKELFEKGIDPEIRQMILQTKKVFENLGITIQETSMPLLDYALPVYYFIGPSETSSNLARYDGIRYGQNRDHFTPETIRRIMIGTYALSAGYYDAFYKKAQRVRTMLIQEYERVFRACDAILMPVTPTSPSKIGELMNDPLQNILADMYTTSQNPVGVPSLAIPCGFTSSKLPIGMQLIGKKFSEDLLFAIGHQYQVATSWHKTLPPIFTTKKEGV
ncbi:MAG: Asp-tRNA(Asn)/Glu-tRNA(Gln) amidotransferase subunit GatA [Candidatus Pacebacteria bacterium]|nr:Asp-tRNA(Asn)/Glu-tRNA(Gln) amidotransferase subunit GatA [Candidatus Paceibacterota bacterium]